MIIEINAAIQSAKVLGEMLKAAQGLKNYNEIVEAAYEVNSKLTSMTAVALEAQEKQLTLSQRISELEKENMELKDWKQETECYRLEEVATGMFAYRSDPAMKPNEPSHMLCANCFTKREKSFLQLHLHGRRRDTYLCPRCKNEISFLHDISPTEDSLPIEDWRDG